ncbi:MAG: DUF2155 domain-containing protein [Rhodospirillaceae bacterium]
MPAHADELDGVSARLGVIDKITARINRVEIPVGHVAQVGPLGITVRACVKRIPPDEPEEAAFLEISERIQGEDKPQLKFGGWMFASSPALSAMDHAVYDVWVLECLLPDGEGPSVAAGSGPADEGEAIPLPPLGEDEIPLD